ncbi:MAG: fused MFS/spermidine synthase [Planctomycetes bacterium]|nr:fused MFS/spermidine synthase [Planctomycetota bacterium]
MEPALRAALVAILLALAAGAFVLPRLLPRGARGVLWALLLAGLGAPWFVDFGRALAPLGVPSSATDGLLAALVLVGPPLVALGALVPLVHRSLATPTPAALGRLLLHEAWGALLAIPLAHFVLVPLGGLALAAAFGLVLGAAAVLACGRAAPRLALAALVVCCGASARLLLAPPLSASAPAYVNPALTVLSLREDREFAVAVVDDGVRGERTLFTDGFRAAGTGREYRYMQVLGHLPVLLHPAPKRVAVLALGTGTTLGSVAAHPEVDAIDVLEIAPAVVAAAPWFEAKNHGVLAREPERVHVLLGDGRRTLADRPGAYDVVTMEPLLPDSPFGVYLYTREFYAQARRALRPGGLLCQWVPPHALEPATFRAVLATFAAEFPWSGVWLAGTQVVLVGGESEPALEPARFPAEGALRATLATLGLASPAGVAARYVGSPRCDEAADGALLTDEHPWVVYRPRRAGAALLADLPDNLAALRALRAPLPERWAAVVGPGGAELRAGLAELQRARAELASEEARQRGVPRADATALLREARGLARRSARGDPELVEFEEELEFLDVVRRGVAELAKPDAHAAQLALERAAELRPERADVALYLAVARERAGDPDAARAVERAVALCPRLARTPEGLRARSLGLSDAAWCTLTARAAAP